jgi:hypothetical protein
LAKLCKLLQCKCCWDCFGTYLSSGQALRSSITLPFLQILTQFFYSIVVVIFQKTLPQCASQTAITSGCDHGVEVLWSANRQTWYEKYVDFIEDSQLWVSHVCKFWKNLWQPTWSKDFMMGFSSLQLAVSFAHDLEKNCAYHWDLFVTILLRFSLQTAYFQHFGAYVLLFAL